MPKDLMNAQSKLVDGPKLLEELFDENSRPSLRWLRSQQKARSIPYTRIGRLVFFDPGLVREALNQRALKVMPK
jgi:hypothetical protein